MYFASKRQDFSKVITRRTFLFLNNNRNWLQIINHFAALWMLSFARKFHPWIKSYRDDPQLTRFIGMNVKTLKMLYPEIISKRTTRSENRFMISLHYSRVNITPTREKKRKKRGKNKLSEFDNLQTLFFPPFPNYTDEKLIILSKLYKLYAPRLRAGHGMSSGVR